MSQKSVITAILLLIVATIVLAAPKNRPPDGKSFYLTTTQHDGLNATAACAAGYHMASIYEIYDPTGLRYDTDFGATSDDSGNGPPAGSSYYGWIRGGQDASGDVGATAFGNNCEAWQSSDPGKYGPQVALYNSYNGFGPWKAEQRQCSVASAVWCVSD